MRLLLPLAAALALAAVPGPGPRDRCPVCGMFVAPYPEWVAAAERPGGPPLYFDGAKDLFRYLHGEGRGRELTPWVTEYYGLQLIPAREAWFVTGSDVLGPMGHELVPLATEEEAREFLRDHRGKRILRIGEVAPQLLEELR